MRCSRAAQSEIIEGLEVFNKTTTQDKRCAGFNNNLDFDNCSHEHPELSVLGN